MPCLVLKPSGDLFFITDVNEAYLRATETTSEELLGRNCCDSFSENPLHAEHGVEQLQESLRRVVALKQNHRMKELRYDLPIKKTGRYQEKYWSVENIPALDRNGELAYVLHTVQDVTAKVFARKQEKARQQEAEAIRQQMDHFVGANSSGLYSLDCEGNFLSLNQGLADLAELPLEQMQQMSFLPFCAEEDREHILENFGRAIKGELSKFEARFVSALGNQLLLEISLAPIFSGEKVTGAYGIARDLTPLSAAAESLKQKEEVLMQQEEALRHTELVFRSLVQEGADILAILDPQGTYTFVSSSATRLLGISPEEFLGKNPMDFTHPDDRAYIEEQLSAIAMMKQFKLSPFRFRNSKGEWRWIETNVTNLLHDPAVQGIVTNSRDITRLVTQEREIKQLNERYRLAATATRDLMYDWDLLNDRVVRFHKGLQNFLGHPITAVEQPNFWMNHIHPDDLEQVLKKAKFSLEDSDTDLLDSEYRLRRADGSYAHISDRGYIIRDAQGTAVRVVGASSDVSVLKANEQALKAANTRFRLAMKATKEIIWDWDLDTGEVTRGKAFKKITGYDMKGSVQKLDFLVSKIHPEDRQRVHDSLHAAVAERGKRKWREEYRIIGACGETIDIVDRGFIVRDANGSALRMVGSALDVTKTRHALKKIKHQNRLLKEIAWDQSHLVRAPLVRMQGLLDLLKMEDPSIISSEKILQLLYASTDEMDQIIREIVKKSEQIDYVS